jgi:hypothetical protein
MIGDGAVNKFLTIFLWHSEHYFTSLGCFSQLEEAQIILRAFGNGAKDISPV